MWRTTTTTTQARSFSSVCTHAQPRVPRTAACGLYTHAFHSRRHTRTGALFALSDKHSEWLDSIPCAFGLGKMSKRAYHWLQTCCTPAAQLTFEIIQRATEVHFCICLYFYFWRRDIPMIFSHVLHRLSAVRTCLTAVDNLPSLSRTCSLHLYSKIHSKACTANVVDGLILLTQNHLQFIQFLTET